MKGKNKLNLKPAYNKELDKTEVAFYSGKKRATDDEIKAYIKENYKKLDREQFPKKWNAYYGYLTGGLKRAKQATRIEGKFVSEKFVEQNALNEVAKRRGYKNPNELFRNDRKYYERVVELHSETGTVEQFYSDNIFRNMENFEGKFIINGKEVSKLEAIHAVDVADKKLRREFESVTNQFKVRFRKGNEWVMDLPDDETIEDSENEVSAFMELQDDALPIVSPKKNKKGRKREAKSEKKQIRKRQFTTEIISKKTGKTFRKFTGTKKENENFAAKFDSGKYKKNTKKS